MHATEFPVESAAEGLARGDDAWRQGKLDLAVYLYVQSLAYDAATAEPFLKIAAIHEKLGNRALAEKAFELGLERDPANVGASERLGLLYLESRQDEAAERLLHAAVRGDPRRWRSYNGLGVLADRRGEYASAERHYDQAHLLQPDNASIVNNRGYSHYLAGKLSAAEGDLRYAVALGAPAGTWTNLGKVLAKQGRYDEALESLLKENDTAHAYNVLGRGGARGRRPGAGTPVLQRRHQRGAPVLPRGPGEPGRGGREARGLAKLGHAGRARIAHPGGCARASATQILCRCPSATGSRRARRAPAPVRAGKRRI